PAAGPWETFVPGVGAVHASSRPAPLRISGRQRCPYVLNYSSTKPDENLNLRLYRRCNTVSRFSAPDWWTGPRGLKTILQDLFSVVKRNLHKPGSGCPRHASPNSTPIATPYIRKSAVTTTICTASARLHRDSQYPASGRICSACIPAKCITRRSPCSLLQFTN